MSHKPVDLEQATSSELIDQYTELASLAGGLAHEIRNPLSSISMNASLLEEELHQSEDPRDRRMCKRLETVRQECHHLEEILNAFLQFVRLGELNPQPTDITDAIEKFIEFYRPRAEQQQIDISPHLSPNLPLVNLDRSLFRQVLLNLAINAEQAMPDGGLLELQTYNRNDKVVLEFIDTGVGMNEEVQEKMFQAFFSCKAEGSGLGLPTVRKVVLAHGGTIQCESEPGKGTRFIITLPALGD
ncbi:Sensor protein ZraS [Polystyrenella longa]|uniref:histidine kinase n=1 Tax=Polystyrenella longa TaxID=2528007 RepID=A0A518CJT4_9PLAN|nr:ATP-binding protein [Polystyrenella longa]QDU79485.1 Sensor protein ZraS [Polystyrenella longa]